MVALCHPTLSAEVCNAAAWTQPPDFIAMVTVVTGPGDLGLHTVCAVMTSEFLEFSVSRGNDLVTPHPEWGFPGLAPGDRWCLCVSRWKEALDAGSPRP